MANDNDDSGDNISEEKPRGCFSTFIVLILLLSATGLAIAMYFMAQPQDLTDIQGYQPDSRALLRRDIKLLLQKSRDSNYPLTLTECEINQWLLGVLQPKQGGPLADKVSLDGVWVRLENGRAEVVLERKVMGHPFTISMYLQIKQTESEKGPNIEVLMHGGPYHPELPFPMCGGRFGKLPVPQGFLLLVMPAFKNLAKAFPEELHLGFEEITRIKIEDERLTLDPRVPTPTIADPP